MMVNYKRCTGIVIAAGAPPRPCRRACAWSSDLCDEHEPERAIQMLYRSIFGERWIEKLVEWEEHQAEHRERRLAAEAVEVLSAYVERGIVAPADDRVSAAEWCAQIGQLLLLR